MTSARPWSLMSCASSPKPGSTITSVRSAARRSAGIDRVPIGTFESPMVKQPGRPAATEPTSGSPRRSAARAREGALGGFLCRGLGYESQRPPVVAVAQAGRLGAVVEDVAVMPAAAHAVVFGALHEELAVGRGPEYAGYRSEKAGPSGAAVEFHRRGEKREAAPRADEHTRALFAVERARPGALGAFVAQHVVGRGRQPLLPFGVRELERLGARFDVRAICQRGFPVLLKVCPFHRPFFRLVLSPYPGTYTPPTQCRQASQPVATIHFHHLRKPAV